MCALIPVFLLLAAMPSPCCWRSTPASSSPLQMGIGRTTTGMVIAGMVHMYHEGAIESVRWGHMGGEEA